MTRAQELIDDIDEQILRLQEAKQALRGLVSTGLKDNSAYTAGNHRMSAEGRERLRIAMKKRWAAKRAASKKGSK